MRVKVMVAWFPYGHVIDDRAAAYVASLTPRLMKDSRIETYALWSEADTPITMTRNKCLTDAETWGADFVLMLDSDNIPDCDVGRDPLAKPFWESSFDFMMDMEMRRKLDPQTDPSLPCVIAAPYSGPPPHEITYIFDWVNHQNAAANPDFALEMVPRHEAALRRGIQRAAALPTGVMLIDMRAVKRLAHPRFYYEWKDHTQSQKASTEDVTFSRDLTYAGIPIYCNWDAWAAHIKQKVVGRPVNIPVEWVPKHLQQWHELNKSMGLKPQAPPMPDRIRERNSFASLPPNFPADKVRVLPDISTIGGGDEYTPELASPEMEEQLLTVAGVNDNLRNGDGH